MGDLAGVFEGDGETAYFYLYDQRRSKADMVVDAIHITGKQPDFGKEDIGIESNTSETKVGLFIKNELWAAFDAEGKKHGGNYESGARPNIPDAVAESFRTE